MHDAQHAFADALRRGPDALPADLFATPLPRALLAMAAYANTVSHGRLVALEDIFPALREAMGEGPFNQMSRAYIDAGCGVAQPLNQLGDGLPAWLEGRGAEPALVAIARFDLAYLTAYHAVDAATLSPSDLPTDPDLLIATFLVRHPAASLHPAEPALCAAAGLDDATGNPHLLLTRPLLRVQVSAASAAMGAAWTIAQQPVTFGDMVTNLSSTIDEADVVAGIISLISAGAFEQGNTDD